MWVWVQENKTIHNMFPSLPCIPPPSVSLSDRRRGSSSKKQAGHHDESDTSESGYVSSVCVYVWTYLCSRIRWDVWQWESICLCSKIPVLVFSVYPLSGLLLYNMLFSLQITSQLELHWGVFLAVISLRVSAVTLPALPCPTLVFAAMMMSPIVAIFSFFSYHISILLRLYCWWSCW